MPEMSNPASRLYLQLAAIQRKSKTSKSTTLYKRGTKLRAVLATVLESDVTETATLFLFLVELANLAKKSAELIQTIPHINHKTYIDPLRKIEKGLLSTNVDVSAKTFSDRVLTDMNILSLRACADMLSTVYIDESISASDINSLRKDVDDLSNEILKIDLPNDLQSFLIHNLEKMRKALIGYKIYGNEGIREVIESALGEAFLRREVVIGHAEDETKRKTLEKFFALIEKATKILSLAEKVKTLATPIISLLLPPHK